ncbi:MAG: prolyl oligopeptidase family serine peptidase, partial [Actinomycetota bacterium]|nr:prolyl oligopeptidase family serine peptidase [Actinomycetota bacterium]
ADPSVARDAGTVLVASATLPGSVTAEDDERRRGARSDAKVSAILHTGDPVRHWDHDLGPDEPRLLVAAPSPCGRLEWTDLTPAPGRALDETGHDIAPDGRTVVTAWDTAASGEHRAVIVALDIGTGHRRMLLDEPGHDLQAPHVSPDGALVAVVRESLPTADRAPLTDLVVVPVEGGDARPVAPGWDRWPTSVRWTADSSALIVTADEQGRAPLFRIDVASGTVTRLTGDHGAYTDPCPSPDDRWVYALRHAVDAPPAPVRVDAHAADGEPMPLDGPVAAPELPGRLTEVQTTAADGSPLRAWLVLPRDVGPAGAPLLLWVHGGPLASWNGWMWRWNPWLMAARGYAVLLPDPALSTGYGHAFVQRGWGAWGDAPYTDLMALVDAVEQREDIDATRTAAMGGSFGGYMANWIAGHTDRFRAIVTHASLWALDRFVPTTDHPGYWHHELDARAVVEHSPHRHADAIRTPMLVIHGDRDYRVPVTEALALWWELTSRQEDPDANPHRFLHFPDENHWVLAPQHAVLWYETVHAFLAAHVLGEPWETPDLLR